MPRVFRNQPKQATGRLGAGQSAQIVVNAHNVNSRTIDRLQHRYNTVNSTNDRPRSGRPRVTTPRQGRFILRKHLLDRFTTTDTARHTTGTQQRPISADTVCRRLASNNIHCLRPARGHILTNHHRHERLQWATARQQWRYQQWNRVLFSDESRFCISTPNVRVRVWRTRGERYADSCVMERDIWGGQSIVVWGAIGISHKCGAVNFQNIGPGRVNGVTALQYINRVLRLHIVPYFSRHQHDTFQETMLSHTLPEPPGTFSSSTISALFHALPSVRIWIRYNTCRTKSKEERDVAQR